MLPMTPTVTVSAFSVMVPVMLVPVRVSGAACARVLAVTRLERIGTASVECRPGVRKVLAHVEQPQSVAGQSLPAGGGRGCPQEVSSVAGGVVQVQDGVGDGVEVE